MTYNLVICAAPDHWVAVDVANDGSCDKISFDGNERAVLHSIEDITAFCDQILNYYNIDSFSELSLDVKVVVVGEKADFIAELFEHVKGANRINIINAEIVIPIFALKKCLVKQGSTIDIECMDQIFTLSVDENGLVSYLDEHIGTSIPMMPEDFALFVRFDCNNLLSDEKEKKKLESQYKSCKEKVDEQQKEIEKQKKAYEELLEKYRHLEATSQLEHNRLQNQINEYDNASKRKIVRFARQEVRRENGYGSWYYYFVMGGTNSGRYLCHLKKEDGDAVSKGEEVLDLILFYNGETEKKCVVKATASGIIHYLVKEGGFVKRNSDIGIIADPSDTRDAVMKWYHETK